MSDSNQKTFKLRNQRHAIIGQYTTLEIVERIASGKYTGDEEVSVEPFLVWQKLSSHPEFYDAFLKRLFLAQYKTDHSNSSAGPSTKPSRNHESAERSAIHPKKEKIEFEPLSKDGVVEEPNMATQQLVPGAENEPGPFRADEIEELFSESESDGSEEQVNHDLLADEMFVQGEPIQLNLSDYIPENHLEDLKSNEDPNRETHPFGQSLEGRKPANKRKLVLTAALASALGFLYVMGQSPNETSPPTLLKAEPTIDNNHEWVGSSTNKEELLAAVLDEAKHFYKFDTLLHYEGALNLFEEAYKLNPEEMSILSAVVLSRAHLFEQNPTRQEDLKKITELIEIGRKREPQASAFYRAEAIIAAAQKNMDLAIEKIGYAQESDPTDLESVVLEAEILNDMGDRASAQTQINRVLRQKPEIVRAYSVAAKISMDLGNLNEAVNYASSALMINPMHANTHFVLGETYQKDNKLGAAIAHFDLVTKLAPLASKSVLADSHFALAKLLEQQGNETAAIKHKKLAYFFSNGLLSGAKKESLGDQRELEQLAKDQEYGEGFYKARAEEFLAAGNKVLGLEYLQVLRLLNPDNPGPLIAVAEVLESLTISNEKLKRIELLYKRAISKDPTYLEGYCKLSEIETDQYNFQTAFDLLNQAANRIGISELADFVAGGCRQKTQFSTESKDEYKLFIALGKHFFKRESYVCAGTFFKNARQTSPVNSEIFYYFGKLSEIYNGDNLSEAERYYNQAMLTDGTNYEGLAGWARVKTKRNEKTYVIKYLRALLENDPNNANLFWVLGEVYRENQEYQRAITFYKKALDYDPRFSKARISLARALSAVGQTYQAIKEFAFAASSDRRNGIGFFEAAQLQTMNKNYQDAELLVRALIESTPNYPGSHRLLSQIYQFQGRQEPAIEEMAKEVENNPQNTKFLIELAEVYMKYQKFAQAVTVLSKLTNLPSELKAPEFRTERTQAFLLISRCYRELGRPENAEGLIKLALNIDSNDPELHRELGYVYRALQRNVEGVKEFEFYLQRNPAGSDADNLKRLIKKMEIEE